MKVFSRGLSISLLPLFLAAASSCGHIEITKENPAANQLALKGTVNCDTRNLMNYPEEMPYFQRLRLLAHTASAGTMESLEKAGATVCLDQRLPLMDKGFFGGTYDGVLYPADGNRGPIVTLWDDGKEPKSFHNAGRFLDRAAEFLAAGKTTQTPLYFSYADEHCPNGGPKMICRSYYMAPLGTSGLAQNHPEIWNPPLNALRQSLK